MGLRQLYILKRDLVVGETIALVADESIKSLMAWLRRRFSSLLREVILLWSGKGKERLTLICFSISKVSGVVVMSLNDFGLIIVRVVFASVVILDIRSGA